MRSLSHFQLVLPENMRSPLFIYGIPYVLRPDNLESKVTAPIRANALPSSVAPVFSVID